MSRTKHTRPRSIIAASRLRRPREARSAGDPSSQRQVMARLKNNGIIPVPSKASPKESCWPLPRIAEKRPRRRFHHPARRSDIASVLRSLPEEAIYGLNRIELRQGSQRCSALGELRIPGLIILYDQAPSPWRIPTTIDPGETVHLHKAGAVIDSVPGGTLIHWPGKSLQNFMLFDVLLHEIGHHILQHSSGKRPARIARTRDHEAFAELFAGHHQHAHSETAFDQ
jgi:hypothetical protein